MAEAKDTDGPEAAVDSDGAAALAGAAAGAGVEGVGVEVAREAEVGAGADRVTEDGLGETADDLEAFAPERFVAALLEGALAPAG